MENIDIRPSQAKFCKKGAQNNFAKFTVKHLSWSVFLIKFQAWCCTTLSERNSRKGVVLCVFRNFWKDLFCRTCPSGKLTETNQKRNCVLSIHKKTLVEDIFFNAVADMWAYSFSKRTPSQILFYENCEVLQKVIFTDHCCATASDFL